VTVLPRGAAASSRALTHAAPPRNDHGPAAWRRCSGRAAARPGQPHAHQPGGHPDSRPPRYHAGAGRTPVAAAAGPQRAKLRNPAAGHFITPQNSPLLLVYYHRHPANV